MSTVFKLHVNLRFFLFQMNITAIFLCRNPFPGEMGCFRVIHPEPQTRADENHHNTDNWQP